MSASRKPETLQIALITSRAIPATSMTQCSLLKLLFNIPKIFPINYFTKFIRKFLLFFAPSRAHIRAMASRKASLLPAQYREMRAKAQRRTESKFFIPHRKKRCPATFNKEKSTGSRKRNEKLLSITENSEN
jgi:hypothetical protein